MSSGTSNTSRGTGPVAAAPAQPAGGTLAGGLDTLAGTDLPALDDSILRAELLDVATVGNRAHAELIRRVDVFDRRQLAPDDGFRTTKTWLQAHQGCSGVAAHRLVKAARLLRHLPIFASAVSAGQVLPEQVQQVVRLGDQIGADKLTDVEQTLAEAAVVLDVDRFALVCERIRAHVDPDGTDPGGDFDKRGLTLSPTNGLTSLRGQLDPEGAAAVSAALDALITPPTDGDTRTTAQRRADALVELARLHLAAGDLPTVGGQRPQVGVLLFPQALSPDTLAKLAAMQQDSFTAQRLRSFLTSDPSDPGRPAGPATAGPATAGRPADHSLPTAATGGMPADPDSSTPASPRSSVPAGMPTGHNSGPPAGPDGSPSAGWEPGGSPRAGGAPQAGDWTRAETAADPDDPHDPVRLFGRTTDQMRSDLTTDPGDDDPAEDLTDGEAEQEPGGDLDDMWEGADADQAGGPPTAGVTPRDATPAAAIPAAGGGAKPPAPPATNSTGTGTAARTDSAAARTPIGQSVFRPVWTRAGWADPPWLDWVGPVPAEVAQRLACDADLFRVILDPASGMPLDVGRSHRLVPYWIRKALYARDRGCRWPGCTAPAQWTDAHHLDGWAADNGKTTIERLILLCRYHHVQVHEVGWTIDLDPHAGEVTICRPGGLPYQLPRARAHSWNGTTTHA